MIQEQSPLPLETSSTEILEDGQSQASTEESDITQEDVQHGLQFLQEIVLSEELKHASYVECLPKAGTSNFDGTPDFWPLEDFKLFPVPRLKQASMERKSIVKETVEKLTRQGTEAVSVNDLQWATWVVRTRGFTTIHVLSDSSSPTKRIRKRKVLLPYLDFMNHNLNPNCVMEVFEDGDANNDETSMYALRATRDIQAGEEVTIVYGTGFETSLDLLDKYGFWLEENSEDQFSVNRNLDWSLVDQEWKDEVESERGFSIRERTPNGKPEQAFGSAAQFRYHLACLYRTALEEQRAIGFDV